MLLHDEIYGTVALEDPVLLSLLTSAPVIRLRHVLQHGISGLIGVTAPITRYEHSVGVFLLVRRLGGNLREQIAALLHDVSHTAFSHVIDYVVDGHDSQSFHEEAKEQYMSRSDLPDLLSRYGYDWRDYIDEDGFPILEQPAPRLCADRLDYFLRDSLALGLASAEDIERVLQHIVIHEGRIATDEMLSARWLAYTFIEADKMSWANFREVGLYELTARAIRRGLNIGHISEEDFWLTDERLWRVLHEANDHELQQTLALVDARTVFVRDADNPTFWVSTKLRSIDPDIVLDDGTLRPLSTLDGEFDHYRRAYHEEQEMPWPMRVVAPRT